MLMVLLRCRYLRRDRLVSGADLLRSQLVEVFIDEAVVIEGLISSITCVMPSLMVHLTFFNVFVGRIVT